MDQHTVRRGHDPAPERDSSGSHIRDPQVPGVGSRGRVRWLLIHAMLGAAAGLTDASFEPPQSEAEGSWQAALPLSWGRSSAGSSDCTRSSESLGTESESRRPASAGVAPTSARICSSGFQSRIGTSPVVGRQLSVKSVSRHCHRLHHRSDAVAYLRNAHACHQSIMSCCGPRGRRKRRTPGIRRSQRMVIVAGSTRAVAEHRRSFSKFASHGASRSWRLKQDASALLRSAAAGKALEVTDHGHPVARLVPILHRPVDQIIVEGRIRL